MKILSLDQSTKSVGLALFEEGNLIDYALIKPRSSKKIDKITLEELPHLYNIRMPEDMYNITLWRTTAITDLLEILIEKYEPDVVYFEDVFENSNPDGYKSLARLQGFIAHLCHKLNIPYRIKKESEWITAWGTYGKTVKRPERKLDIMQKVNDLYNLEIKDNDVSDAIAIGRYAVETQI